MILIADSGSTKTQWSLITQKEVLASVETIGFNPYFTGIDEMNEIFKANLKPLINAENLKQIAFYGAGCASDQNADMLNLLFRRTYPQSEITINSDVDAAAKSLWGTDKGIAAILGTGSNACYYNGNEITERVVSLGYLFGDEGGGVYFGKEFISLYLHDKLPSALRDDFNSSYDLSKELLINAVYKNARVNRYLASFFPFIIQNRSYSIINEMIELGINRFFDNQLARLPHYSNAEIGFIGSVAHFLSEDIKNIAKSRGISVSKIVKDPMKGLIAYHQHIY